MDWSAKVGLTWSYLRATIIVAFLAKERRQRLENKSRVQNRETVPGHSFVQYTVRSQGRSKCQNALAAKRFWQKSSLDDFQRSSLQTAFCCPIAKIHVFIAQSHVRLKIIRLRQRLSVIVWFSPQALVFWGSGQIT